MPSLNSIRTAAKRLAPPTLGISLAILLTEMLAACAQFGETKTTENEAPLACPQVLILSEGAKLTRFAVGAGQNEKDILHREVILGYNGACEIVTDDDGATRLVMEISPEIASDRGPANFDGTARFEYFVALTDSAKRRIAKRRFVVNLEYGSDGRQRWSDPEPAVITIPLKPGENGQKWIVFIGLQPTRAELEYMRSRD